MRKFALGIAGVLLALGGIAQEGVLTFGLQARPLLPNRFVNFTETTAEQGAYSAVWTPRLSLNFGGVVRYGITDAVSIETGINLVRRNYQVDIRESDINVNGQIRYAFAGYEIPVQGMFFVRLGKQMWMNAAGGLSIDMYPSSTFATSSTRIDTVVYDFEQFTARSNWVQLAVQANYGFEYRSKASGYFYLGVSFHRPFTAMALTEAVMTWQDQRRRVITELDGTYFTVDLRYFFHEDPERRR